MKPRFELLHFKKKKKSGESRVEIFIGMLFESSSLTDIIAWTLKLILDFIHTYDVLYLEKAGKSA